MSPSLLAVVTPDLLQNNKNEGIRLSLNNINNDNSSSPKLTEINICFSTPYEKYYKSALFATCFLLRINHFSRPFFLPQRIFISHEMHMYYWIQIVCQQDLIFYKSIFNAGIEIYVFHLFFLAWNWFLNTTFFFFYSLELC